jgi:hypothetical protein
VKDFAAGMDISLELVEATKIVDDWRAACPETVKFWDMLNEMLHSIVEKRNRQGVMEVAYLPDNLVLRIFETTTPQTLLDLHPGAMSVGMSITDANHKTRMLRVFHGCYLRGRDICYYKPSDLKTGDLWRAHYVHPKTKQLTFHKLYGGKLAGILTQSFCRELFMEAMVKVYDWTRQFGGQVQLVGQFHDELVLDWKPGSLGLDHAKHSFEVLMSSPQWAPSFPLAADIKSDYRYTK